MSASNATYDVAREDVEILHEAWERSLPADLADRVATAWADATVKDLTVSAPYVGMLKSAFKAIAVQLRTDELASLGVNFEQCESWGDFQRRYAEELAAPR